MSKRAACMFVKAIREYRTISFVWDWPVHSSHYHKQCLQPIAVHLLKRYSQIPSGN